MIGERVEGQERDRDRQRDLDEAQIERQAEAHQQVHRRGDEEVVVFEVAEQAEIADDPEPEEGAPRRSVGQAREGEREGEIEQRAAEQDDGVAQVPERVEEIAGRDQEPPLGGVVLVENPGERKDQCEEERELNGWEQHWPQTEPSRSTGSRC
jgi:hypothetical protein